MQQQNAAIMAPSKPLVPHATIPKPEASKPVLVCILDGWGENVAKDKFNAIHVAQTTTTDALKVHMPSLDAGSIFWQQAAEASCTASARMSLAGGGLCGRTAQLSACPRTRTWATAKWATTRWVSSRGVG